jgi:hypothetical protein
VGKSIVLSDITWVCIRVYAQNKTSEKCSMVAWIRDKAGSVAYGVALSLSFF